jgi:outer membrane protein OmpA-like peptidoglycan-associated protein/outer membrane protein assembly factor BamD (BamD/ComL family)
MIMRLSLFVFLLFCTQLLYAQKPFTGTTSKKAERLFGEALKAYTTMEYKQAFDILRKCTDEDPKYIDAWMLLADIRELNDQHKEALTVYKKIISINPAFQLPYYKLAKTAMAYGEYDTSLHYIERYIELNGTQISKAKVENLRLCSEFGREAIKHPVPFDPINIKEVNTSQNEYFPGTSADDQMLIFTRLVGGQQEDFYTSKRQPDGTWGKPYSMGPPINTDQNEGTITLSPDGQYVFFTGCNRRDGQGSCDIYFSALDGNDWKEPRNLGFPVNTSAWESQPSLSFDGKTLYFTSNRPGGMGDKENMDIWYSTYNKGKWSAPINMGPEINTPGNEQCPVIAKDNQTLYFNSDGHVGMGGVDLFVSRKTPEGRWGKPENLGYPINTAGDEICLVIGANGKDAYYVSERPGGAGGLDLYQFELYEKARPQKTGYLKGIVFDANTKKKLKAHIELIDLATAKTIVEAYSNKLSGEFLICLQGNKDYALNVSCEGYLFHSENFSLKSQSATDPLVLEVPLYPIEAGGRVVLKNIFFDVDKYTLKPESKIELDKLAGFLKTNPTITIELSGHTDNTGLKQKNLDLSKNRARAVMDYLIEQGIPAARLSSKGYADTQPIADNKTEAGRQKNRRTEFKIISK